MRKLSIILTLGLLLSSCAEYGGFNGGRGFDQYAEPYINTPVTIYTMAGSDQPVFKTITPSKEPPSKEGWGGIDWHSLYLRGENHTKEYKHPSTLAVSSRYSILSFGFTNTNTQYDYLINLQDKSKDSSRVIKYDIVGSGINYYKEALSGKYSLLEAQKKFLYTLFPNGKINSNELTMIDGVQCVQSTGENDGMPYVMARCPIFVNNIFGIADFAMGMPNPTTPERLKIKAEYR